MSNLEKLLKLNGFETKLEVDKLKKELAQYDYIGVKIATGVATIDDYKEQIAHCEELRKRIRELENG